jgi:hypothetical protein
MIKVWQKEEAIFSDEVNFPVCADDLNLWTETYCKKHRGFTMP